MPAKSSGWVSRTPTSTTSSSEPPPAATTLAQLAIACLVCSWIVDPARAPVAGSIPGIPETWIVAPALTPWEYNGELGAPSVRMISRPTTSPLSGHRGVDGLAVDVHG